MFKNLISTVKKSKVVEIDKTSKAEFINIPIQLLSGFLDDSRRTTLDICHYSIYSHFIKIDKGNLKEKYRNSCEWLDFPELDRDESLRRGRVLHERYKNSPMTGIERYVFSEYCKIGKSDFDKACFLAFHALKSIVGEKTFQKIDNKLLWARMDGKTKTIKDVSELSEKMRFFAQEYQTLKMKRELQESWRLIYYAQQTRGFYVSFKMDLKSLIMEVVKRKRKTIDQDRLNQMRFLEKKVLSEFSRLEEKKKTQPKNLYPL